MVNWRALPKFLILLIAIAVLMATWRWFAHG